MMLIEHQIALTWRFVDIMQNVLQPQTRLPNPISHVMHDVCACVIAHTRSVGLRESGAGGGCRQGGATSRSNGLASGFARRIASPLFFGKQTNKEEDSWGS